MSLGIIFLGILTQLIVVAWIDLKTKKISNLWPILNAILSIVLHVGVANLYPLSWELALFPVGFLLIGFFLYLFHVMGAGDSKYLASLFLVVPLEYHLTFFTYLIKATITIGLLLLTVTLFRHGRKLKAYLIGQYWQGIIETIRSRFSYAPVILLAWLLFGVELWM